MSYSLNKIMIIGNLGGDAETRFTTNNKSITSFSVATTNSYKGKDGNWVDDTTWHNCIGWDLPEYLKAVLLKGKKFYVEGRLVKRDYVDKEGIKRYVTEIITNSIIPLSDSRGETSQIPETGTEKPQESPAQPAEDEDSESLPF